MDEISELQNLINQVEAQIAVFQASSADSAAKIEAYTQAKAASDANAAAYQQVDNLLKQALAILVQPAPPVP